MRAVPLTLLLAGISAITVGCRALLERGAYVEQAQQNAMAEQCGIRYFRYDVPSFYKQGDGAPDYFTFEGKAGVALKLSRQCLRKELQRLGFDYQQVEVHPSEREILEAELAACGLEYPSLGRVKGDVQEVRHYTSAKAFSSATFCLKSAAERNGVKLSFKELNKDG